MRMPSPLGMSYYEAFLNLFDVESDEKQIEYQAEFLNGWNHIRMMGYETEEEMTTMDFEKKVQMIYYVGQKEDAEEMDDDLDDGVITVPKLDLRLEINGADVGGVSKLLPTKIFCGKNTF